MRQNLSQGRLPSSLLFAGIAGVGKGTLAHFLAKAANCRNLQDD
jgi:DNA polymerase III gamma/tau subunit